MSKVAGVSHYQNEIRKAKLGDPVELREGDNGSIAVHAKNVSGGYQAWQHDRPES